MARITVEDCIQKFPSRFELVLVASQRARKLHSGEEPTVDKDNDKNTVIALREIADTSITVEVMKENLIQEYQTITINDEEEENQEIESFEADSNNQELIKDNAISLNANDEVEAEMKDLIVSEESELEDQYEISDNLAPENESSPSEIESSPSEIESSPSEIESSPSEIESSPSEIESTELKDSSQDL